MLKVHLLGHQYISQDGQPLRLPAKTVALLTYLTLQGRPQHREHLAELLWDTPDSLRNLRVELARLHQLGLDLFPARSALLEIRLESDLEQWLGEAAGLPETRLSEWLSQGSSPPLSGLEDLGSAAFREWVDSQRWAINQQIEAAFSKMHLRALQAGRSRSAALICSRAEQLGIELRAPAPGFEASSRRPVFKRQATQQQLTEVLELARRAPQMVLFGGRSNSAKREAVRQAASGEWQVIEMQVFGRADLQQAAFLHQLVRVLPPEWQAAAWQLLNAPGDPADDLVRTWTLVAASGLSLIITLHGLNTLPYTLLGSIRFALELPGSLMLVLCASSESGQQALRETLNDLDHSRLHQLSLPPLKSGEVMAALAERQPTLSPDQRLSYANRIVQQSDGWDLHAQALIELDQGQSAGPLTLPEAVRDVLLSRISPLDAELRAALARWAMVHAPITPELARLLAGENAPALLHQASKLKLLLPAADQETVWMPHLRYRHSDAEEQVGFCNEPLRAALASTLSSLERRELRATLARYFLTISPALSRLYARQAGLAELPGQRGHLIPAMVAVQTVPALPDRPYNGPATPLTASHAPGHAPECRTGNGYRVFTEHNQLKVMRNGLFAPAPLLRLRWPEVAAGHWVMLARLDVQHTPLDLSERVPYALGLRTGDGPRLTFSAEPSAPYTDQGIGHQPGGLLPLGHWFRLSGHSGPGELELSTRTLDLALTIAELSWNDKPLLARHHEGTTGLVAY